MAGLTQAQVELLAWIVECSSSGDVLFEVGATPDDDLTAPNGSRRPASPHDFRELVANGSIRYVGAELYEVTEAGRTAYQRFTNLPPPGVPLEPQP